MLLLATIFIRFWSRNNTFSVLRVFRALVMNLYWACETLLASLSPSGYCSNHNQDCLGYSKSRKPGKHIVSTTVSAGGLMEGGIAGNFTKTLAYTWNTLLIAVIKVELCNEHSRFLENWTESSQNKVNGKSNYSFQQCPVWSKSPTVPPH